MERPLVGLSAIIRDERSKILFGLRKGSSGAGTWSTPGGHQEGGRLGTDELARGVREETDLIIQVPDQPCFVTDDIDGEYGTHYRNLFYECVLLGGTLKLMKPDKCVSWEYFASDDLPSPLFLPVKNLIRGGYKL